MTVILVIKIIYRYILTKMCTYRVLMCPGIHAFYIFLCRCEETEMNEFIIDSNIYTRNMFSELNMAQVCKQNNHADKQFLCNGRFCKCGSVCEFCYDYSLAKLITTQIVSK